MGNPGEGKGMREGKGRHVILCMSLHVSSFHFSGLVKWHWKLEGSKEAGQGSGCGGGHNTGRRQPGKFVSHTGEEVETERIHREGQKAGPWQW